MNNQGAANMDCILQVDNLGKRFNDLIAVDSVSFTVRAGECFGLLGPNGAGKTSTIRMMYGFSPPSSGAIRILGLDIATQWRLIRSRIGSASRTTPLIPT